MTYTEAATYGDGHVTSLNFLKEIAEIKSGQKVSISGASGSHGATAVQLARSFGAEVTGVCSSRNEGLVKSLGAEHVNDYTREDFTPGKFYRALFDITLVPTVLLSTIIAANTSPAIATITPFRNTLFVLVDIRNAEPEKNRNEIPKKIFRMYKGELVVALCSLSSFCKTKGSSFSL